MMISRHDIAKMTRAEKLQALEAIWADLLEEAPEIESPAWHEDALRKTEAGLGAGKERILDWEEAKLELSNRPG